MKSLHDDERSLYDEAWAVDGYDTFSPGEHYLPIFLDVLRNDHEDPSAVTVLDAGCGAGKGSLALRHAGVGGVIGFDITDAGLLAEYKAAGIPFIEGSLWKDVRGAVTRESAVAFEQNGRVDWVYCTDVMEHVPEAMTMLVIHELLSAVRTGVFLSISLVPDQFGAMVGRPLHQTVRDFMWWKRMLSELGTVTEARDLLNAGVYVVRP